MRSLLDLGLRCFAPTLTARAEWPLLSVGRCGAWASSPSALAVLRGLAELDSALDSSVSLGALVHQSLLVILLLWAYQLYSCASTVVFILSEELAKYASAWWSAEALA